MEYLEKMIYATYYKKNNETFGNWQGWNDNPNVVKFTRWIKLDTHQATQTISRN